MGELCAERDLISFSIKKPCKDLVVQHSQAATRGHRQPRPGLSSLPHSLPGRMEHLRVPPRPDPPCSLLTGKRSCSFPALLGKGIGQLESGKERKDLDFCKGWSDETLGVLSCVWVFWWNVSRDCCQKLPCYIGSKVLRYEKTSCVLFPAFSTKTFLLFFPS